MPGGICENRRLRCSHLALLGSIVATTGWVQAANLVSNGGMEVPAIAPGTILTFYAGQTFGGWTVSAGSIDVVHGWQNAEGLQSIDLSGSSQGTIYQDVPTVAGRTYDLSFAMASDPYWAGTRNMDVYWGDVLVDSLSFATAGHTDQDMGWMYHSYMLTATGNVTRLLFKDMTHDNDGYYGAALDDVVLTPEPTTLLLLAVGGLAATRRKRQWAGLDRNARYTGRPSRAARLLRGLTNGR